MFLRPLACLTALTLTIGACGPSIVDEDEDGVAAELDCDDTDPTVLERASDADCDGVLIADDCDDANANRGDRSFDADCDDVLTENDCDDANVNRGDRAFDADCDGVITEDDCDDTTEALGARSADSDCDGLISEDDCDDRDPQANAVADDLDCDGALVSVDCNDGDARVGDIAQDADCDGALTTADCDDDNVFFGNQALDADCDGVQTDVDCDDLDSTYGSIDDDEDCDGWVSDVDCDDANPGLGSAANDWNCDGALSLASSYPESGAIDVDVDDDIVIVFDEPVDPSSLGGLRFGAQGRIGATTYGLYEDEVTWAGELEDDQRTVRLSTSAPHMQEFETTYWIEIAGVTNQNGNVMDTVRMTFQTVMVDEDYEYRLRNVGLGGALDTLPGTPIEAYLFQPFTGTNYTGSIWTFTERSANTFTMHNAWLGADTLLDSAAGNRPTYMFENSGPNSYRTWRMTYASSNNTQSRYESPRAYYLESLAMGSAYSLGSYSTGANGVTLLGMVSKTSSSSWVLYNRGRR